MGYPYEGDAPRTPGEAHNASDAAALALMEYTGVVVFTFSLKFKNTQFTSCRHDVRRSCQTGQRIHRQVHSAGMPYLHVECDPSSVIWGQHEWLGAFFLS